MPKTSSKYNRGLYEANKTEILEARKDYYQKNREKILNRKKLYREENKHIVKTWKSENKDKVLTINARYVKKRMENDQEFKLRNTLSCRLRNAIKLQYGTKANKTIDLLGCTIEECRKHLEQQFKVGMTWNNHGDWHIDHIRPCASFDLTDPEQQKQCFNYKNLQPLWADENMIKSNKY